MLGCGAVCGGGVPEGTMLIAQLLAGFQSLPLLSTSKLGPSGANSRVGGFVYLLGPCGLSNEHSCEVRGFSCHPHRCFQSEALRLYFPTLKPWVAWSVSVLSCSSPSICMQMWGCPLHQLPPHLVYQPLPCHRASPPGLPISAHPTGD